MTHSGTSFITTTNRSTKLLVVCLTLFLQVSPVSACIWIDTHNNYLYSIYDNLEFRDRAEKVCNENWKAYLGNTSEEQFYFNMQEVMEQSAQKGDKLMSSYLQNLDIYLKCAREVSDERWEYPTKEQLNNRKQSLLQVRTYAKGQLKSRLRSQHALLFMRCNMLLGQNTENIAFWETTATQYIWTIYKDMMRDIYAGALLHAGRADEAGQHFAELGDWQSLMTQYYKLRSYQAISEEYHRDPNSAVLPFLLQDFVNNAQEAVDQLEDGWEGPEGKLFVRDIQKSEAMQMCQLARKAVSEGRSKQPVMWQSALAWLEFLFGNQMLARADINRTASMEGTSRMKDCARVLRLYISTATTTKDNADFDKHVTFELQWLDAMTPGNSFFYGAKDRLVHKLLAKHYTDAGRISTAMALLLSVHDYYVNDQIDTMSIANMKKLVAYVQAPGTSPIDIYAAPSLKLDANTINDILGTKYLRLRQWKQAQEWLKQVPISYYSQKGYAPYAAYRSWAVEPWITRQWLKDEMVYSNSNITLQENPKLAFATEMEDMESGLSVLSGTARQQRCYDLAVRYAQAAYTGDCWFVMRDGKSICDSLRANEADLLQHAQELLRQACLTNDQKLKERALFALSYRYLYPEDQTWFSSEWNDNAVRYDIVLHRQASQYKALKALANFANYSTTPESDYVSRCDEYRRFKKYTGQ